MDVMRTFVGIHRLEVEHVPDDAILVGNAVAAMHVPRDARYVERLAAIVALHERDCLRRGFPLFHQTAKPERAGKTECDLGLHVRELFLDKLVCSERPAELCAIEY